MRLPLQVVEPHVLAPVLDGSRGLWRASIERAGPDRELLRIDISPLLADAAILTVIARDLAGCYAGNAGQSPMPYAQFAEWQNEALEGSGAEAGKQFWSRSGAGGDLTGCAQATTHSSFNLAGTSGPVVLTVLHVLLMRLLGRPPRVFWASRLRRFPNCTAVFDPPLRRQSSCRSPSNLTST